VANEMVDTMRKSKGLVKNRDLYVIKLFYGKSSGNVYFIQAIVKNLRFGRPWYSKPMTFMSSPGKDKYDAYFNKVIEYVGGITTETFAGGQKYSAYVKGKGFDTLDRIFRYLKNMKKEIDKNDQ
jgi:hypothetical protein